MREILFRGKRVDNGEWVYGDLVHIGNKSYISYYYESALSTFINEMIEYDGISIVGVAPFIEVDPITVGQYTGLIDKNGKKIFEGDAIRVKYSIRFPIGFGNSLRIAPHDIDYIASVIFDKCRFYSTKANGDVCEIPLDSENIEIIGNIHDNPELLEVTE